MPTISVQTGTVSGFSQIGTVPKKIETKTQVFSSGGFGDLYICEKMDGVGVNDVIIKLLKDPNGIGKTCFDTVLAIQDIIKSNPDPDKLVADIPSLTTLPLISFTGKTGNTECLGYGQKYLKGFNDFDDILTNKFADYKNIKLLRRLEYAYRLVKAMKFLSDSGFIHADINAPNLFVNLNTDDLVLLDLDSGEVVGKTKATTFGKIGDFIAPEITQQIIEAQKKNQTPSPTTTYESDRWSVAIAISYILFLRSPLFFFKALTQNNYDEYRKTRSWPDANPSESYFSPSAEKSYSNFFSKAINHPGIAEIKNCFSKLVNEGYNVPTQRPSYDDWIKALESTINTLKIDFKKLLDYLDKQAVAIGNLLSRVTAMQPYGTFFNVQQQLQTIEQSLNLLKSEAETQKQKIAANTPGLIINDEYSNYIKRNNIYEPFIKQIESIEVLINNFAQSKDKFKQGLSDFVLDLDNLKIQMSAYSQFLNLPNMLTTIEFNTLISQIDNIKAETQLQLTNFSAFANSKVQFDLEFQKFNQRLTIFSLLKQTITEALGKIDKHYAELKQQSLAQIDVILSTLAAIQNGTIKNTIAGLSGEVQKQISLFEKQKSEIEALEKSTSFIPIKNKLEKLRTRSTNAITVLEDVEKEIQTFTTNIGTANPANLVTEVNDIKNKLSPANSKPVINSCTLELGNFKTKYSNSIKFDIILKLQTEIQKSNSEYTTIQNLIPNTVNMKSRVFNWVDIVNPSSLIFKIRKYPYFNSMDENGNLNGLFLCAQHEYPKALKRLDLTNLETNRQQEVLPEKISHLSKQQNELIVSIGGSDNLMNDTELSHAKKIRRKNGWWILLLLLAETFLSYAALEAIFPAANPNYRTWFFIFFKLALAFVSTFGLMILLDKFLLALWPPKTSKTKSLKERIPLIFFLGLLSVLILIFIVGLAFVRAFAYESGQKIHPIMGVGFVTLAFALPLVAAYLKYQVDSILHYHETLKYIKLEDKIKVLKIKLKNLNERERTRCRKIITQSYRVLNKLNILKNDGDNSLINTDFENYDKYNNFMITKYGKL
jgi:serine/threonine protein kinase